MKRGGDRGRFRFGEGVSNHGNAKRQSVSAEAARDGDAAKSHEVGEIGVGAEASIEQIGSASTSFTR